MSLRGSVRVLEAAAAHTEGGILQGVDPLSQTLALFLVQAVIIISMTRYIATVDVR
jgi:hypothetical protein